MAPRGARPDRGRGKGEATGLAGERVARGVGRGTLGGRVRLRPAPPMSPGGPGAAPGARGGGVCGVDFFADSRAP